MHVGPLLAHPQPPLLRDAVLVSRIIGVVVVFTEARQNGELHAPGPGGGEDDGAEAGQRREHSPQLKVLSA